MRRPCQIPGDIVGVPGNNDGWRLEGIIIASMSIDDPQCQWQDSLSGDICDNVTAEALSAEGHEMVALNLYVLYHDEITWSC